jgi:hypothetical protein
LNCSLCLKTIIFHFWLDVSFAPACSNERTELWELLDSFTTCCFLLAVITAASLPRYKRRAYRDTTSLLGGLI